MRHDDGPPATDQRTLVLNPVSGDGSHTDHVRELADAHGFDVRETERSGDAIELARTAAEEGADLVAACGGDGTLNEAVRGLWNADALPDTAFAVVPGGTGNNFAGNVGVEGLDHAFDLVETGEWRTVDLGLVRVDGGDPVPFLNSCVGGLTANASASTSSEQKDRFGVLAYVFNALQEMTAFDGLTLDITPVGGGEHWRGDAACVLVGNGRRFPAEGGTQANMEDGHLDVTVVEDYQTVDLAGEAAVHRLFGRETENITRLQATALDVTVREADPVTFSLDGELATAADLHVECRAGVLRLPVGEAYDPAPE
ncbi:diacylglycerol/lipid kinase family protein [Halomarina ordinaria]|uniref:Diacylglycerol/lipid kinase family protein n=1 Tax=Halomarina ordinaria TaxID=3033939 RepID=A0ABD5U3E9_9EURY|nr:diacylglycerol kinase family protein [Halomarina sp. PSRA2]